MGNPLYERYMLEGRIPPDIYARQQAASTATWDPGFVSSDAARSAIEDVVFRRHDNTLRHVIPWIEKQRRLAGAHVIDFGSGCGSSALAFSHIAGSVDGFEIDAAAVAAARARMELFGANNVSIHHARPDSILQDAIDRIDPDTSVALVAVVEHLLESEQLEYLRAIWARLSPGQILAIAETPNYYSWFDSHTFQIPFASMIPDAFFAEVIERSPQNLRFRENLLEANRLSGRAGLLEARRRFGLGVTHHVFELAFEQDLNALIVSDGYDPDMLGWFGILPDDRLLLSAFEMYNITLPVGFARSVLAFVFRKPRSTADEQAARSWNAEWRKKTIETHSLLSEKIALQNLLEKKAARS